MSDSVFISRDEHTRRFRSALISAGLQSAAIDRIIAEDQTNLYVLGYPLMVVTHDNFARVRVSMKFDAESIEFDFPPNDERYLRELKRAQDNFEFVQIEYVIGETTKLPIIKSTWIRMRIHERVSIVEPFSTQF